jgi:uncharacterized protein (UPF0332 family)
MKETFLQRSQQNIAAANLLLEANLHDASANRSYYAVFDAALVACLSFGVAVEPDYAKVLSAFSKELIARRKVFASSLKEQLYELQRTRIRADYGASPVSKNMAHYSLRTAQTIVTIISGRIDP